MADYADSSAIARGNAASLAKIAARVNGLSDESIRKADKLALAGVRRKFEPEVKRVIREQYNVPLRAISGKFRIVGGSDAQGEYLALQGAVKRVPLAEFGARWGGRRTAGATATILRGQTKTYTSAFIRVIGGQREVLARQFSADSNSPSGRHPREHLQRLRGPSPAEMARGIDNVNAARIAESMTAYRLTELTRQLQRARKGG